MHWLTAAFIGMSIWSVTAVVDRFALNGRITDRRFYVAIPALLQFPLTLLFFPFFTPSTFDPVVIAVSVLGGLIEVALLYYLFVAISTEEIGRIFPLTSVSAILTLFAGTLFFGDVLSAYELIAFVCMILGGCVLAFRFSGIRPSLTKSITPLLIGAVLASAYTLALRFAFIETDFATGFFFSRIGFFLGGMVLVLIYWRQILTQWRILSNRMKILVLSNQTIAFSGHAFYFSALAIANAALVQSVLALQGIIVFVLAVAVSLINPRLVSESVALPDLVQKTVGILLILLGCSFLL